MSIVRTIMVLTLTVSALYFLFRLYSSIRRIRSIGFLNHYRLYMPMAGLLVSGGAAWIWASPRMWYASGVVLLAGLLIALREIVWAIRAAAGMVVAKHALVVERRNFRQHTDDDRKLLAQLRQNLESAGWACKARRFRDAHRSALGILHKLKLNRRR